MVNKMETINNKYKIWHDNIIAKAKSRTLEGYKEIHHILPRCMGGNNSKDNLVSLTAKEHFIIHILLCKFTTGLARRSMLYAHKAMSYYIKEGRNYKIGSRIAEKLRKELKFSPEHIENLRKSHLGKPSGKKGKKASKETIAKLKLVNLGKKASEETLAKLRLAQSNMMWINKNGIGKKIKKHLLQEYLDKGYKVGRDTSFMNEEYKKNMSKIVTKIWQDRRVA
jgi:hypothetical protein